MTAPTGLVVESVEGLAEALHRLLCSTRNLPQQFCSAACGGIAEHLIASGAVRPAAEVRAEGVKRAAAAIRSRDGRVDTGWLLTAGLRAALTDAKGEDRG